MDKEDRQYINPRRWLAGAWVPEWLLHHPQLSPGAKLLYVELASLYNEETGCAWPSVPYLAQQLHCSEREVQKQIRELVEAGVLEVEVGCGRSTSRYRFPIPPGTVHPRGEQAFTSEVNGRSPQEPVENSANPSTTRVSESGPGGDQIYLPNLKKYNMASDTGEQTFDPRPLIRAMLEELRKRGKEY